jgi:hypothetical protein
VVVPDLPGSISMASYSMPEGNVDVEGSRWHGSSMSCSGRRRLAIRARGASRRGGQRGAATRHHRGLGWLFHHARTHRKLREASAAAPAPPPISAPIRLETPAFPEPWTPSLAEPKVPQNQPKPPAPGRWTLDFEEERNMTSLQVRRIGAPPISSIWTL